MIPVPKPKYFERKNPVGQSEDDYFDEICARQAHILGDAIDRVSFSHLSLTPTLRTGCVKPILNQISLNCGGLKNFRCASVNI